MRVTLKVALATAAFLAGAILLAAQDREPAFAVPTDELSTDLRLAAAPTGPSAVISTIAGIGYVGYAGDGGPAINASLFGPSAVAVDSAGNVYIAEPELEDVRRVDAKTSIISLYAGSGFGGYAGDNGPATSARLNEPYALAVDAAGDLYIADSRNNVIRKVNAKTGIITTVAGTGYGWENSTDPADYNRCGPRTDGVLATKSDLCDPWGIAVDPSGNLFIADIGHITVRRVDAKTGIITTVAGSGHGGYSGDGGPATEAELNGGIALVLDHTGADLYIGDSYNCAIRRVVLKTGVITSVVGQPQQEGGGLCGYSGDGGLASKAEISSVYGLAIDAAGDLFIPDEFNNVVRMIAATGKIYTIAGSAAFNSNLNRLEGITGYSGDGGPAGAAELNFPRAVAVDSSGNLYIDDEDNEVIRKVAQAAVTPVNQPIITPASGSSAPPVTVTISAPVKDATIYYTTDGTLPTTSSKKYSASFKLSGSAVVTAFAAVPGAKNSTGAVAAYLSAPAPTVTPAAESISKATSITIRDSNAKAQIYYTLDGTNPTTSVSAQLYSGPVAVAPGTTLQAVAWVSLTDFDNSIVGEWSSVVTAIYSAP